ncbi:LysE family translocator, partial [Burkholderia sp. SIMBA_057]
MPNFLLFLTTSVAITMAPGPDNLQVLARGISQGR